MTPKFDLKTTKVSHKVQACPVSYEQVDKHLIKAYSSIVLFVLLFTLLTGHYWLMYLITLDFIIRVFAGIKYSPLCKFLTSSMKQTRIKPLLVNAGTKKIAAQVGLFFCLSICLFHLLGWQLPAMLFLMMFITAISLDLLFDYCLACKMQSIYLNFFNK